AVPPTSGSGVGVVVPCRPRLAPTDAERRGGHQTEWILLTSGTTGPPKLVVHTLASLAGAIREGHTLAGSAVWSTFYDIRRDGGPGHPGPSPRLLPGGADRPRLRLDGGRRGVRRRRWARGLSGEPARAAGRGRRPEGRGGLAADPVSPHGDPLPRDPGPAPGRSGRLRRHRRHGRAAGGPLVVRRPPGGDHQRGRPEGPSRRSGSGDQRPSARADVAGADPEE